MTKYTVTGMSCAACSARVEKAVAAVPGVTSVSVSLLTNSMGVEGTADPATVIRAVTDAGYGASLESSKNSTTKSSQEDALADHETPRLKRRLIASLGFLAALMYFSMGHMMLNWPIPAWFSGNCVAQGMVQLLLTTIVMVINQKFFISGFKGLIHKAPNMDTLVALGSAASYLYSVYVLFAMTAEQAAGNAEAAMSLMHEFYFESAAMILTLITVGKMLEARSKGKTTDALKSLIQLAPQTAVLVRNGKEETVPIDQVKRGDIFAVRPGESIPADGRILEGVTAVNESALTGESIPVDKTTGDTVSAATINVSGYIRCEATGVGEDTALSHIIQMVSDAAATKAPIAKIADTVSGIFVPVVMSIAAVTVLIWLLTGQTFGFALARGISVLVISCPCALGLATPVAIMVGNGVGARNGILFKTAESLEIAGRTQICVMDKTGTITKGEPSVTDVIPASGVAKADLIKIAVSLEKKSEHPLAKAVIRAFEMPDNTEAEDFTALPGNGVRAVVAGKNAVGGNLSCVSEHAAIPETLISEAERLSGEGKTPLFFVHDAVPLGIIAVADSIKEDAQDAVRQLHGMGIRVIMLTGDNARTANAIGKNAGVDEVIAGVRPEGKADVVAQLKRRGKVAMVGDGINDAPALTGADVGFAIGAGTDVAIDAADVVLMKSRLCDVPAAIRLSRATLRNIRENLFWAFFYNVIGIPLAAGLYYPLFGWQMNPMFGAAAMSLSSFCVVSNALRLNLFDIRSEVRDRRITPADEGEIVLPAASACPIPMQKGNDTLTIRIDGMMCEHCENAVRTAVEKIEGVQSAEVSHKKGTAVVTLTAPVNRDLLRQAIEAEDYTVLGFGDLQTIVIQIDGMMCEHCENAVRMTLEKIEGVQHAEVSHKKGTATVTLTAPVDSDLLKQAVEAEDYTVLSIE